MSVEHFDALPVDTSEAIEFDNSPFEEGTYTLKLTGARGRTSQAGNPVVTWEFTVMSGDAEGRKVWHDTVTTGAGSGMFRAVINSFGYEFEEVMEDAGNRVTPALLAGFIGDEVDALIYIDTPDEDTLAKYPNATPKNRIRKFV